MISQSRIVPARFRVPQQVERFKGRGEKLDCIVCSPAERARATGNAFAKACGLGKHQIDKVPALYFQGLRAFELAIQTHGEDATSMMLVSHNPDLTGFANSLDESWHIDNVPTCGLLRFDCDIKAWQDWSTGCCRFVYYDYPKNPHTKPITESFYG